MKRSTRLQIARVSAVGLSLIAASGMSACRGDRTDKPPRQFFPDMDDQPRIDPQSEAQFFLDNRSVRQPADGSVAFGYTAAVVDAEWNEQNLAARSKLLKEDDAVYLGLNPDGTHLARIPMPVTEDMLERGAERFGIFCAVCHGYNAEGATPTSGGMAGRKWAAPVPGLYAEQYQPGGEKGLDGYIFSVIRNGVWGVDGANRMPGYAHSVDEYDAWAIVAHLRTLQAAERGSLEQLDEPTRQRLESSRVAPPPVAAPQGEADQDSEEEAQPSADAGSGDDQ